MVSSIETELKSQYLLYMTWPVDHNSERKGVEDSGETSNFVLFKDSVTEKKAGGTVGMEVAQMTNVESLKVSQ